MQNSFDENDISDFLAESDIYMEQLEALPFDIAAELYDLLDDAAFAVSAQIEEINPELRVELCDRRDKVLERIIDVLPPFENNGEQLSIFSPSLEEFRSWYNFQLLKDCGIAGYLLAEVIGAKPVMYFGTSGEQYPYLSLLPGLEMHFRDPSEHPAVAYREHLEKNYHKMDVLVLYGMYTQSPGYLEAYRRARPDGKVYCGLDMNTYWIKTIDWDDPAVKQFQQQCNVIATSCRFMRDILNRSEFIHFPCHWLPNGFYNPAGYKIVADAKYKENTILTVGRIGSPEKNHEELMVAFAEASKNLPGWKLRLVGPVDDRLQPFLDAYFSKYPKVKNSVILTGAITNKAVLYDEYARAKVFTLTSRSESGTPNVYAEALFHGCMFVTSDIDGADDITNYGELGEKYTRGDIKGLTDSLAKVCSGADLVSLEKHIPKALEYAGKYYVWSRNAKKIAYMLFK